MAGGSAVWEAPGKGDAGDLVTLYVTHKRSLFPFRTHRDLRGEAEHIFKHAEYRLYPLAGWTCDTVVDVGANFGAFSLFMKMHYGARRLLAYEPVASTFGVLEQNLRGVEGFEPRPVALLDRDGETTIHHGTNPALHSIVPGFAPGDGSSETIALRRASAELDARGVDAISVLKIDTEGCEVKILADLAPWLARTDFVLFEYHSEADRRALDKLLHEHFVLYGGHAARPELGTFKYVARRVLARYPVVPNPAPAPPRV